MMTTGRISQQSSTESLITVGNKCCEEDGLDEVTPCELSNDDIAMVTVADETKHIEVMKGWAECSVDVD